MLKSVEQAVAMHLVLAGELGLVWTEFKKRRS